MTENKKTVHPRMAEAIANAEKAAVSNRGMYPHTKACNVFQGSGERMEELPTNDSEDNSSSSDKENGSDDSKGDSNTGNSDPEPSVKSTPTPASNPFPSFNTSKATDPTPDDGDKDNA